jgi:hypothetical protein
MFAGFLTIDAKKKAVGENEAGKERDESIEIASEVIHEKIPEIKKN